MSVDPFVLAIVGFLLAMIIALLLIGRFYPGSGLEQVGMRSAREITERREAMGWNKPQFIAALRAHAPEELPGKES